jgi:hypothetical protein
MTTPQHSAADFAAAERCRTMVHDHHWRIIHFSSLKGIIAEEMPEVTQQVISDLLSTCSLRELARRLDRSPTHLSHIKNGHSECSHELFEALFGLWQRLPANMQGQQQ